MFIGRTDAKAEGLVFWSPNTNSRLTGKHPEAGRTQRQNEKGVTEDEMVR